MLAAGVAEDQAAVFDPGMRFEIPGLLSAADAQLSGNSALTQKRPEDKRILEAGGTEENMARGGGFATRHGEGARGAELVWCAMFIGRLQHPCQSGPRARKASDAQSYSREYEGDGAAHDKRALDRGQRPEISPGSHCRLVHDVAAPAESKI